ncbi:hypothetical protein Vadar_009530 [Vaccinium darrowii]|uniref:Uncharacterized protein n=1 Tax=Vaccinium darrowii TaxID=229202 RepID=A0ACB7XZC0_9ERIC|nr:hypothetical protein Vadar_009530 [Vaccinium darrowii]
MERVGAFHHGDRFLYSLIEWYNMWQLALNNVERLYQGKDTADIVQSKVLQLLNGKNKDLKVIMEKVLISRDFSSLDAECLTDTWSGKDRNMSEAQAKPRPVVPESVLKEEKISEWALKKNEELATLKRKNVEFELRNIRMSMRSKRTSLS